MPFHMNWISGAALAAEAVWNWVITVAVSSRVGTMVLPVAFWKRSILSWTYFSMPAASCSPHHHIWSDLPPAGAATVGGTAGAAGAAVGGTAVAAGAAVGADVG